MKYIIYTLSLFLIFFSTNNTFANDKYLKCLEKITEVRIGSSPEYVAGKEHGYSFVKLNLKSNNPIATIHFKSNTSKKPLLILENKQSNNTTLGFDINHQLSEDNSNLEVKYSFIKVGKDYAFSKKEFMWSIKNENTSKETYDYDSSSRCQNLSKEKYLSSLNLKQIKKKQSYNWAAISKHPKSNKEFIATELSSKEKAINLAMKKCYKFVTNNLNKIGYNDCYLFKTSDNNSFEVTNQIKKSKQINNQNFSGERALALSWESIDDLIVGTLSFNEKDMIGKINFKLSSVDTKCIGTYVLSTIRGTWSILCEKDNINASGTLKWNSQNGSVSGTGKDEKGNVVKFKVAGSN
tara:strand:+ start:206 stop:1258 length:1053 start_codon:yes stop_codon:yes gene_type:complete